MQIGRTPNDQEDGEAAVSFNQLFAGDPQPEIARSAVVLGDVHVGPGAMIHGCHIGRGSVVEPAAIVCDGSVVGAESVVRAGACVKQRDRFGDRAILDGFPAKLVGHLTAPPPVPGWALPPDAVATLRTVQR